MNRSLSLFASLALAAAAVAGAGCGVSTPTAEASTRPVPTTKYKVVPAPAPVSPRDLLHQLATARVVRTSAALPRPVVDEIVGAGARLADPGQPFQVTDVVFDDTLPWRRLFWAVTDGHTYLVHYEAGGIGHSFHLLLVSSTAGGAKVLWHAAADGPIADYAAFRAALDRGTLDEDPRIRH
jgi:hypothetical protein